MATYDIYGIGAVMVETEVKVSDAFLAGVLDEREWLNAFQADAGFFDCGNKQGYLCANLAVGMRRDPDTSKFIKELIEKSDWQDSIKALIIR